MSLKNVTTVPGAGPMSVPDAVTERVSPQRPARSAVAPTAIVAVIVACIIALSLWYAVQPQPLLVQGDEALEVAARPPNLFAAQAEIARRQVFGVVSIPAGTEREVLRGRPARIRAFVDSACFLVYNRTLGGIGDALASVSADLQTQAARPDGSLYQAALARSVPLDFLSEPLFNPTGGYGAYVVPAALVLILQESLLMGVATLGGVAYERHARRQRGRGPRRRRPRPEQLPHPPRPGRRRDRGRTRDDRIALDPAMTQFFHRNGEYRAMKQTLVIALAALGLLLPWAPQAAWAQRLPPACPKSPLRVVKSNGSVLDYLGSVPGVPDLCHMSRTGESAGDYYFGTWRTDWPGAGQAYPAMWAVLHGGKGAHASFITRSYPGLQWVDSFENLGVENVLVDNQPRPALRIAHERAGIEGNTYHSVITQWKDLATGATIRMFEQQISGQSYGPGATWQAVRLESLEAPHR